MSGARCGWFRVGTKSCARTPDATLVRQLPDRTELPQTNRRTSSTSQPPSWRWRVSKRAVLDAAALPPATPAHPPSHAVACGCCRPRALLCTILPARAHFSTPLPFLLPPPLPHLATAHAGLPQPRGLDGLPLPLPGLTTDLYDQALRAAVATTTSAPASLTYPSSGVRAAAAGSNSSVAAGSKLSPPPIWRRER